MMNPEIEEESRVIPREETDAVLPRLEQELRETVELTQKSLDRVAESFKRIAEDGYRYP